MERRSVLNTTVDKRFDCFILFFMVSYFFYVASSVGVLNWGDDATFFKIANEKDFNPYEWLSYRYNQWSGRVSLELIMITTISKDLFWRIGIPASLLLLFYSISKIVFIKPTPKSMFFVMILVSICPVEITSESVFWVTGFYNYLLPCSLSLYCFSVIKEENPKKYSIVFASFSVLVFSFQEQVFFIFMLSCLFNYDLFKVKWRLFIMIIFLVCGAVLFSSPGNIERLNISYWGGYPQFIDFTPLEKVMLGMDKVYQFFLLSSNWPVFVFVFFVVLNSFFKDDWSFSEGVSVIFSLLFLAFFIVDIQRFPFSNKGYFDFLYRGGVTADFTIGFLMYFCYLAFLFFVSSVFLLVLGQSREIRNVTIFVVFLGSVSVAMMGFSPTVYSSTYRVHFVFEVSIIIAILYQVKGFLNRLRIEKALFFAK